MLNYMIEWGVIKVHSLVVGLIVLALDLLTKGLVLANMTLYQEIELIPGFFSFQFVYNPGAAFGILAGQKVIFIIVASAAVIGIALFSRRPEAQVGVAPWALGMIMGGAAGNLVDRIRFGKVIDFFLFYYKDWAFPNFNVADIGITVGVGLLILHLIMTGEKEQSESI